MFKITHIDSVDSTNAHIARLVEAGEKLEQFESVIAKEQTAGRGKWPAAWFTKIDKSLILSTFIRIEKSELGEFIPFDSMMAGAIAAKEAINNSQVKVKYPNDLYIGDKKLAGVLGELISEDESGFNCVVGIGLNVDLDREELPFEQATSLKIEGLLETSFNEFVKTFTQKYLTNLSNIFKSFEEFAKFKTLEIENADKKLVPAIVQNFESRDVLMLGFMNNIAYAKTKLTSLVTFWSRSRNELWTKGETSQNFLKLKSLKTDCDDDAILIEAEPVGPTCHTGNRTCFD